MIQKELEQILSKDGAKLYFIGIGGIAMSAAANLARDFGYQVAGSDSQTIYPPAKDVLIQNQVEYFTGYNAEQAAGSEADLFVLSAGEGLDNPEVKHVVEKDLPRVGLAQLLYELSKDKLRIVVAGTHGKSTTAALLGHLVKNLDNSSFVVGAVLQNYQSNFHSGSGHYFVFEGDEYKEQFDDPTPKFHYYKPDILVLTNLEYDHPDQFASLDDLQNEFRQLLSDMPEDGLIVYNGDNADLARLVHESNVASISFGLESGLDFVARDIQPGPQFTNFGVANKFSKDSIAKLLEKDEEYQIQLPGKFNVYNALAAIATLRTLGFGREDIALDLVSFLGLKRRFEIIAQKNGITIIDDYAHHPTAVKETLAAARARYPEAKIWAVFEPHTYSRTRALLAELAKAFTDADEVLISEIYPARESAKDANISSQQVISAIKPYAKSVTLVPNKAEAVTLLKKALKPGDVVVIMAVGSFNRLAYELKDVI
ncbi:MAG: UDP-N-acetylmuramate--L-alanine ligase [Patescibacteria group bacterium]|nr:UDP-N-acetylmuramate--L-alanine ligase [Patescibacteria group bacterium]